MFNNNFCAKAREERKDTQKKKSIDFYALAFRHHLNVVHHSAIIFIIIAIHVTFFPLVTYTLGGEANTISFRESLNFASVWLIATVICILRWW